jgi:hypothetical protein
MAALTISPRCWSENDKLWVESQPSSHLVEVAGTSVRAKCGLISNEVLKEQAVAEFVAQQCSGLEPGACVQKHEEMFLNLLRQRYRFDYRRDYFGYPRNRPAFHRLRGDYQLLELPCAQQGICTYRQLELFALAWRQRRLELYGTFGLQPGVFRQYRRSEDFDFLREPFTRRHRVR